MDTKTIIPAFFVSKYSANALWAASRRPKTEKALNFLFFFSKITYFLQILSIFSMIYSCFLIFSYFFCFQASANALAGGLTPPKNRKFFGKTLSLLHNNRKIMFPKDRKCHHYNNIIRKTTAKLFDFYLNKILFDG